ncbi:uncharacterized protein LOC141827130 [Curcuma longa]|uniref:uncharacterized protein LOC141827130 n=1 Tax=Curcuma longa TaxID=136217 RepID=UPI003D9E5C41
MVGLKETIESSGRSNKSAKPIPVKKTVRTTGSDMKLKLREKVGREPWNGKNILSEVVHHTQAERDERTREARERSFKADDASSAVDHVVPLKDSEPEIGMFVSRQEKNTSLVWFNQTLPETDESGEQPTELETSDHIYNETGVLKFHANESESQDELGLRSREKNVQKDHTGIPKNSTRAQSNQTTAVDPTIVARYLQNLTAVHPFQTSTETAKLEVPTTKNEVMGKTSDDQNLKTSAL